MKFDSFKLNVFLYKIVNHNNNGISFKDKKSFI